MKTAFLLLLSLASVAHSQTLSLTVDNATTTSGQTVTITVSYTDPSPSANVAALQWNLAWPFPFPPVSWQQGAAATAAGKSLQCNGSLCVLAGLNTTVIGTGPLASAQFQIPLAQPPGLLTWGITGAVGSNPNGMSIAIADTGTISVSIPGMPAVPLLIINSGSTTDKYFSTSVTYTDPMLPTAYPTLRYASTVTYQIPLPVGLYAGHLVLVEPNRTAAGQRIMTVTVQGQTSPPVDIFATVGIDKPFMWPFVAPVTSGYLTLTLTGQVGNAVVSGIVIGQNAAMWDLDMLGFTGTGFFTR